MKPALKKLILAYAIIVLIKIILAYFIKSPTGFWDEYINLKMARGFYNLNPEINFEYPPLYSIMLSIAYIFKNMKFVYFLSKVLNALMSTLVIIPAYLLSKEFLKEKYHLYIPILIVLLPSNFSFSNYILAENLFYPLFFISIYFIYKSLKENNKLNNFLAVFFIALSLMTKIVGLILIFVYLISHIISKFYLKKEINYKNLFFSFLILFLLIFPMFFINYKANGFSMKGILGETVKDNVESFSDTKKHEGYYWPALINWIIIHIVMLTLSSGVILFFTFLLAFNKLKEKNNLSIFIMLSLITIIGYILVLSNNALGPQPANLPKIFQYFTGRPISRYIDVLLPLIIILGVIGLDNYHENPRKKFLKKIIFLSIPFFAIGSQLTLDSMLPINNLSISFIGASKLLINYLINNNLSTHLFNLPVFLIMLGIFILIPLIALIVINKASMKKIFYLIFLIIIISNVMNFSINYYKSNEWSKNEQMNLGLWFNENNIKFSNILIDIRNKGDPIQNNKDLFQEIDSRVRLTLVGFWMNDNLIFDNVKNTKNIDFIISSNKLNLPIIKKTENLFVYKVEK
ncbi:glycosyltransferase family 39 protein [Candidatus Woesearchaeota archaeon]|nr:glycosyltransferase family 39 protein [Candidatus Woesearchaeota archaeon]